MVAEEDQHHRGAVIPERVRHGEQVFAGVLYGAEIVVEYVIRLRRALAGPVPLAPVIAVGGVGTVPLIGYGEVKVRHIRVTLFIQCYDVGQKDIVICDGAVRQVGIPVLEELVVLKAQVGVHVFPVIEPIIAGVAACDIISVVP